MNRRALAFTGGSGPPAETVGSLIPPCDFVCAADSGLDTAVSLGYLVDTAIGDFDSLRDKALLEQVVHTRLDQDKDITDTEALLQLIRDREFASYVLVGGGEGRFDHLLHLYSLFATYGPPELWITARECMYLVKQDISMGDMLGKTVSVLPALLRGNSMVNSHELKWNLNDFAIDYLHHSVSNRCVGNTLSLHVQGDPVFLSIPFP